MTDADFDFPCCNPGGECRESQDRLERNPQAIAAIQRAERDLREGRAVAVEVEPWHGKASGNA